MSEQSRRDVDRELNELTSELRVLLAAATVLFAFLLTIPFSFDFAPANVVERSAYSVAFLSTAFAVVLFVGETAYHRLTGKPYDKHQLVTTASRQAGGGIVLLAVALVAVVFLVTDVLYPRGFAVTAAAAVLSAAAIVWFAIPLARRWRRSRQENR